MDLIEELQEQIYKYLTLHTETPKTISEIYNSLEPHNNNDCNTVHDEVKEFTCKAKFMEACYSLDKKYNNIHLLFKSYMPLLVHSLMQYKCVLKKCSDLQIVCDSNGFTVYQLTKLILGNASKFHLNDNFLKYTILADENTFKKLHARFNLEADMKIDNCTLLEWAEKYESIELVKFLMECKYKKQIYALHAKLNSAIAQNTELRNKIEYLKNMSHYQKMPVNPKNNVNEILLGTSFAFLVVGIFYRIVN